MRIPENKSHIYTSSFAADTDNEVDRTALKRERTISLFGGNFNAVAVGNLFWLNNSDNASFNDVRHAQVAQLVMFLMNSITITAQLSDSQHVNSTYHDWFGKVKIENQKYVFVVQSQCS